jgi:hypothetical protein
MHELLFWLLADAIVLANALGRRIAGGVLSQWVGPIGGTQVARLVQAVILGASVAVLAPVWWWGLPAAAVCFCGAVWGFPRWFPPDFRASHMVPRDAADAAGIAVNGMIACAPLAAGAALAGVAWWPFVAAGLARGPFYWLAAQWSPDVPWLGVFRRDPPPFAELLSGAALGAAVVLALAG